MKLSITEFYQALNSAGYHISDSFPNKSATLIFLNKPPEESEDKTERNITQNYFRNLDGTQQFGYFMAQGKVFAKIKGHDVYINEESDTVDITKLLRPVFEETVIATDEYGNETKTYKLIKSQSITDFLRDTDIDSLERTPSQADILKKYDLNLAKKLGIA